MAIKSKVLVGKGSGPNPYKEISDEMNTFFDDNPTFEFLALTSIPTEGWRGNAVAILVYDDGI